MRTLALLFFLHSTMTTSGYREDCTIDAFRRRIREACAIFVPLKDALIKRKAEYLMAPITEIERPELIRLWGYYLKEWQSSQTDPNEPSHGLLYQVEPEKDTPHVLRSALWKHGRWYSADSAEEYHLGRPGWIPVRFHVIPADADPDQNLEQDYIGNNVEGRSTRNVKFQNLVVKCCNDGCKAEEFSVLVEEFSVCTS